jgi:aromatic ring-opening dioxygenase catalytic subunit (LigB family)
MSDEHSRDAQGLSRRGALATAAIAGVAVAGATTISTSGPAPAAAAQDAGASRATTSGARARMPVINVPHGGGPWPFAELGFSSREESDELRRYLSGISSLVATRPTALLVLSAHWEESVPTIMTAARPPLLFDYYGFPEETYRLTWPAPNSPTVASRAESLLRTAGFRTATNDSRGYDHGTFVPLKVAFPDATMPVVQVSLKAGLDPEEHLAMGRALAPLRDEGVLIVGSGMSYHNMRGFGGRGRAVAEAFDQWLREAVQSEPAARDRLLREWSRAPHAREAHPREEHLIPLMVIAGAAGTDRGSVPYNGTFAGVRLSAHHFG